MDQSTARARLDVDDSIHGIDPDLIHDAKGVTFDVRMDKVRLIHRERSPWIEVETPEGALAIWGMTGAVHRVDDFGAVEDDPIELPAPSESAEGDLTKLDEELLAAVKLRPGLRTFEYHEMLREVSGFRGFEKTIQDHLNALEAIGLVRKRDGLSWSPGTDE